MTGTLINIKRLSWDGTKQRADEVLDARKRVTHRPLGVIPGCIMPHHTPSLLEMMPKSDWAEHVAKEVAEYKEIRRQQATEKNQSLQASITKGDTNAK